MHSIPRVTYVSWLLLHLLTVAVIGVHETLSLVDGNLTILRPPTVKATGKAVAASSGRSPTLYRHVERGVIAYANLAGIEAGYGYFAPNVPETHALVFEIKYADGRVEYESPVVSSHEGELRLTSLIEQIGRTKYDDWRNELIRRLARSTWQRHPSAISIRGFFGSVTPPTLAAYRAGRHERTFTCQYVYDFQEKVSTKR